MAHRRRERVLHRGRSLRIARGPHAVRAGPSYHRHHREATGKSQAERSPEESRDLRGAIPMTQRSAALILVSLSFVLSGPATAQTHSKGQAPIKSEHALTFPDAWPLQPPCKLHRP